MQADGTAINIHLDPLLPVSWLALAACVGLFVLLLALLKNKNGVFLRLAGLAAFILILLNPSLLKEKRQSASDVAVIVVDQSPSQNVEQRTERTTKALTHLKQALQEKPDLDVRILKVPAQDLLVNETLAFEVLEKALVDVPPQRRAGVIFLSDGQIHDTPKNLDTLEEFGPIHILLSGNKNEKDRQVVITQAPAYGIVGQTIAVKYKVEDTDNINQSLATITVSRPGMPPDIAVVPVNTEQSLEIPIEHAGQNIFELSAEIIQEEISTKNNRTALIVNGVRDRLRVLLVSGQPHAGGRTWRDLLTSDPGVDLVHFTILREPNKLDATPQKDLSLIAFPFRELFEIKLHDFDLIVFDRYQLNRILPENYFNNIARYVEKGGALLEASGPSFADKNSIYFTGLMDILPGAPIGEIIKKPYRPALTADGNRHPVTRKLAWPKNEEGKPSWGRWLRQVALRPESGDILLNGADEHPLLILERVKEGRVAQIASDHIWLWARGYEGGGPYTELLRRIVHWLMKEPELDEKALKIQTSGNQVILQAQNYKQANSEIAITKPDGETENITLKDLESGILEARYKADQLGIYGFENSEGHKRYAVIGDLNPPELRNIKTTPEIMKPLVKTTKGGIMWLSENPEPRIRMIAGNGNFAGRNWLGLNKNNNYSVTGVEDQPLLAPWMGALLLLTFIVTGWWYESRNK